MGSPFQVGDVVVCVDASTPSPRPFDTPDNIARFRAFLVRGAHYRVSEIVHEEGIRLEGDPLPAENPPAAYWVKRFRKIDQAGEQFTREMRALRPIKVREDA